MAAAVYDGLLGAAFLFASGTLFRWFGVTPPNHPGYVQFPAALLIVFAIMFIAIAMDPVRNRDLIPYGILLKLSYCGVVLFHWLTAGIPDMWKPFCLFDLVFLIVFAWAWTALRKEEPQNG
jgi:preprotein translocase subunit SecY